MKFNSVALIPILVADVSAFKIDMHPMSHHPLVQAGVTNGAL